MKPTIGSLRQSENVEKMASRAFSFYPTDCQKQYDKYILSAYIRIVNCVTSFSLLPRHLISQYV